MTGSFTATVNAELKVGAVAETVTVSGPTPTVDLRNAKTQQTFIKDVTSTLPTGGPAYASLMSLVPGVNAGLDLGGVATTTSQRGVTAHGSRTSGEGRVQIDGFGVSRGRRRNAPADAGMTGRHICER